MAARLADRLQAARRRAFVGRRAEVDLFEQLLHEPELPVAVLYVWGPGGVGKSTVLRRWADCAENAGVPCLLVDARNVSAQPDAVLAALDPAFHDRDGRAVVVVDTYELLTGLEPYLRDEVLPRLPAQTLVVLAGQEPPSPG